MTVNCCEPSLSHICQPSHSVTYQLPQTRCSQSCDLMHTVVSTKAASAKPSQPMLDHQNGCHASKVPNSSPNVLLSHRRQLTGKLNCSRNICIPSGCYCPSKSFGNRHWHSIKWLTSFEGYPGFQYCSTAVHMCIP